MKRPYYIFSSGRLKRKDNTLYLYKMDGSREPDDHPLSDGAPSGLCLTDKSAIPIEQVEALYCFGEMDLNTKLITFLCQHHVPIFFFDYYGNFTGTLYPRDSLLSGRLRVSQAQHYLKPAWRMKLARVFVEAAAYNILRVLKYYQTRQSGEDQIRLQAGIERIEMLRGQLDVMKEVPALMGIEGNIRDTYYSLWPAILGQGITERFPFDKRERNPPSNELNALISFGNALCYGSVLRQIYRTALDPTISYLHEPGDRRFSLALDLSEVFKPLLVDRAIFKLLKTNIIQPKHFEARLGGVYLKESGRQLFVQHWDERLRTVIQHRALNRKVSYERLIRLDCYSLIRHLIDPNNEPYKGFKMWW
ncbi:MAG TPA: type I-B CRISPR-associated endonuclease Cas1b [Rhodothermales bacterium]|nr:type I-B CRISPR-associated endonuclease Cas1b [Rhodothermales bacterium]